MADSIVWLTHQIVLNLESISYVQFEGDGAKIVFVNGEMIAVGGKDCENFARYLREKYPQQAKPSTMA